MLQRTDDSLLRPMFGTARNINAFSSMGGLSNKKDPPKENTKLAAGGLLPISNKGDANKRLKVRGLYYRMARNFRRILANAEKIQIPKSGMNRSTYRKIRNLYYCIVPALRKRLIGEDLVRLQWVCDTLYHLLVCYKGPGHCYDIYRYQIFAGRRNFFWTIVQSLTLYGRDAQRKRDTSDRR